MCECLRLSPPNVTSARIGGKIRPDNLGDSKVDQLLTRRISVALTESLRHENSLNTGWARSKWKLCALVAFDDMDVRS